MNRAHVYFAFAAVTLSLQIFASTPASERPDYNPLILKQVREKVQALSAEKGQAVVVFDLDDTLINSRERNVRLLQDFTLQPQVQRKYPDEVKKLDGITYDDIRYLIKDTLKSRGIQNEEFVREMETFWSARFFTNTYCAKDVPLSGASEYVTSLSKAGAIVVYLTGRNWPGMGQGTVMNLLALGFPMNPSNAVLMMKPQAEGDDFQYKNAMFAKVAAMGTVVAAFENEPANINGFQKEFADATMVFLDTTHSTKPIVPNLGVQWVADFSQ